MANTTIKKITIFKQLQGVGARGGWSNTYYVSLDELLTEPIWDQIATELALVERKIHSDKVFFSRAVVSTLAPKNIAGAPDRPRLVPLGTTGMRADVPEANGISHKLPGIAVLEVNFGAGLANGRHTYRHCILSQDWKSTGEGVELTQALRDSVQSAWNTYMEQRQAIGPLVNVSNTPTGEPGLPMTRISVGDIAFRQLTQQKGKKKGADEGEPATPTTPEEEVEQAVQVVDNIVSNRYTEKAAAYFRSAAFAAAMAALGAAYNSFQDKKVRVDYGPENFPD